MRWEAPAKLNLSLHVAPPRPDGYHPLESIVQTIEWCDHLMVEMGEGSDSLDSDIENNLVLKAVDELRRLQEVPALDMSLEKHIPIQAGLGGGSADAAAALRAAARLAGIGDDQVRIAAGGVGADVSLFLDGGTSMMTGVGGHIERLRALDGFAVAVVVPGFGLSTAEVYRRWDQLEGPAGEPIVDEALPPSLRGGMPMRNDLTPAAIDVEPRLGDFMADLRSVWGTAVSLTGSGSACFGYFGSLDEASDAAAAAPTARVGRGVALRDRGVAQVEVS